MQECQCIGPGYCSRHKMVKTKHLYEKCKNSEHYRKLWDEQISDCGAKAYPSLLERIKTFSLALAKHIESGFKKVNKMVYDRRLEICAGCASYEQGKCVECGCILNIKAEWATEDCPLEKWPKIELPMIADQKVGSGCGSCGQKR
jgi:hypothetical protein